MKDIFLKIFAAGLLIVPAAACYSLEDEQYAELSPIEFNDVPTTIDVMAGEELVYDRLEVKSDLPLTYEWSYGPRKQTAATSEYDMQSIQFISDKPDIRYTFTRLGQYILRLKVDNGESIEFKYFTLNVNSGVDEGLLILSNDDEGKGSLTFIRKSGTDGGSDSGTDEEIWDDVFSTLNPAATPLHNVSDMIMADHTASGVQYAALLISTDDDQGRIYNLNPKTLELNAINTMVPEFATSAAAFAGIEASGSNAFYTLIRGKDKSLYRYDLFGNFLGELSDVSKFGGAEKSRTLVYSSSATSSTVNRKAAMYNGSTIFRLYNAKEYSWTLEGYDIVNFSSARTSSKTYILFRSKAVSTDYTIKQISSGLTSTKFTDVIDFSSDNMSLNEDSFIVSSRNSADVYFTSGNSIYRWGLTVQPASSPVITLPDGEEICDVATNYMDEYGDGTEETLLYVATYNPARPDKKGSVYVYDIATQTLQKVYEGICDRPVKLMYKYRIS